MVKPLVSIIVPCYNQGQYLDAALQSVAEQTYQDWEAIIVNDGSLDHTEEVAFEWVEKDKRFIYYANENQGLVKSRNFAITKAKGKYILPLDSDNQLICDFIECAVNAFEQNKNIGVVHGDALFFGVKEGYWKVPQYDFEKMLADNFIDSCAIYKKSLWEAVGGYDVNLPHNGLEDWEFWVALGNLNTIFHHLNKVTFKYFVATNSMIKSFTDDMAIDTRNYLVRKYFKQYRLHYEKLYRENRELKGILKNKKFIINLVLKKISGFTIFKSKGNKYL
jgi:glycosyltransferase involved in cell wall biosynthesis